MTGALDDALAGVDAKRIAALGITNQRETTLLWERDGRPAGRQRDRLAGPADGAVLRRAQGGGARADGARADRAGARSLFLGDEDPLAARRRQRACARGPRRARSPSAPSTASSSGGSRAARRTPPTSPTPRARCSSISRTRRFSDELCALFGVPAALLPEVCPSAGRLGETRGVPGLPDGIPIAGVAGDQQAALYRPGLHRAGRRQVHLRDGRVPAHEHRPGAAPVDARPADDGRLDAGHRRFGARRRPPTRSRGAPSSPARWCSGCATGSASSAARRRSRRSRARCPIRAASPSCPALTGLGRARTGAPRRAASSPG